MRLLPVLVGLWLSGCGTDQEDLMDLYDEVEFDSEAVLNKSQEDLIIEDLVRKLALYYRTIGCSTPDYTQFAIHTVMTDADNRLAPDIRAGLIAVRFPIIKTIRYGKHRAVPYAPFHQLMAGVRNMAGVIREPANEWRQVMAGHGLQVYRESIMSRDQQPHAQVHFNRVFLGLAEYFAAARPTESSRLLAIEFLEHLPFNPSFVLFWAIEHEGAQTSVYRPMIKVGDAIAGGFAGLSPAKRQRLFDIVDEYVRIFEQIDDRSVGDRPDAPSLQEFHELLARIDPLLDDYIM